MDLGVGKPTRAKSRQSISHVPPSKTSIANDNMTADVGMLQRGHNASISSQKKKLRGKSIGPGGLEALQESSGNATKTLPPLQIKSILKPTVPLTPPKVIPSFDELRQRNNGNAKSTGKSAAEELLIDFSTPAPNKAHGTNIAVSGTENVADPFSPLRSPKKSHSTSARDEEQDQEAELKRQADKKAILERRAARRKSLANRRVSFAPEATLHTWSVMELAEDSTTSSASNSTRRQSSITAAQSPNNTVQSPAQTLDRPTTPVDQVTELQVQASPASQRGLHQKKRRRRSSTLGDEQLDASMDEVLSSSPSGDVTTNSSPIRINDSVESESSEEDDDGTAMSIDDSTSHTLDSDISQSSTQSSLDERLRHAADQAGTRGIDYDENGDDLPMDIATTTVTHAFQPWQNVHNQAGDIVTQDQENINPLLHPTNLTGMHEQADSSITESDQQDDTQDMSMDVTSAVGRILNRVTSPVKNRRKSSTNRRRSSMARRRSSGGESSNGDETMDFTTVGGGILNQGGEQDDEDEKADMTMEFTNVVGGLLGKRRESIQSDVTDNNETMDMTAAVGTILPPIEEQTEPQIEMEYDQTAAMDMTRAVGFIHATEAAVSRKQEAKHLMQIEADANSLNDISLTERSSEPQIGTQPHVTSIATETGSPDINLRPRLSGRARPNVNGGSTTPTTAPKSSTPTKSVFRSNRSTPTKQFTPLPMRVEAPNKTPPSANVAHRGASPKKLFKAEIKARASPAASKKLEVSRSLGIFAHDEVTGNHTPSVVLTASKPRDTIRRRSSGVGIDQCGFGSPRVSELLDRRSSIGEAANKFKVDVRKERNIRFENPKEIEHEVDAERAEDERRESGRFVLEQEANEQQDENATLQLKEMIQSMTPKKSKPNKFKGRKSLAVGAAKGLLGKRPAELDLDEDDDSTPKRLKAVSREGSPVKKIHLPKPPSKEETTGRLTRTLKIGLDSLWAGGNATPAEGLSPVHLSTVESPHVVSRFKDSTLNVSGERPESFGDKLDNVVGAIDVNTVKAQTTPVQEEKISLQDFLNMTNIHFIELSTTKRRHTVAATTPIRHSATESEQSKTEGAFISAATTLPLLELYQHATRELKSYISAGRKIIKSIEAETLADQPPLFREYVDARPDVRVIMDNQFRNGKSNARLQSKEGWYTWRSQLVEGLHNGLLGIKQGMQNDADALIQQLQTLSEIVPDLRTEHKNLQDELLSLQQSLAELDDVDFEELNQRRDELKSVSNEHAQKLALLERLKQEMLHKDEVLSAADELKEEMQEQIAEANRVREEHRGWPIKDVSELKTKVQTIKQESGWHVVSAEEDPEVSSDFGAALTLVYKEQLHLFFHPAAFLSKAESSERPRVEGVSRSASGPNAPISLTYSPSNDDGDSDMLKELTTEKRFVFQMLRSQLHSFSVMPRGTVTPRTILRTISDGWKIAAQLSEEIRLLGLIGITKASIVGDEDLEVKLMLMLSDKSRLDIKFSFSLTLLDDGALTSTTNVVIQSIYGPSSGMLNRNSRNIQQSMTKETEQSEVGKGAWVKAIHALEDWIQTRRAPDLESKPELPQPQATAPASVKRSPLARKKINVVQKKALPVPKHRIEKPVSVATHQAEKENLPIPQPTMKQQQVLPDASEVTLPGTPRPAIPPEMQEIMMHSPVKRIGALRRSPI